MNGRTKLRCLYELTAQKIHGGSKWVVLLAMISALRAIEVDRGIQLDVLVQKRYYQVMELSACLGKMQDVWWMVKEGSNIKKYFICQETDLVHGRLEDDAYGWMNRVPEVVFLSD